MIVITLATFYFVFSQLDRTGFFTSSFGSFEAFLFYLPIPFSILAGLVKITSSSRNKARPLDVLNDMVVAAAGFYLFVIFPFNFSRVGALLPLHLGFWFSWIPSYLGRFIMLVAGLAGFANMIYTSVLFVSLRSKLSTSPRTGYQEMPARFSSNLRDDAFSI